MFKKIALAATVAVAALNFDLGSAHAAEASKEELRATFTVQVAVHTAKCDTDPSEAALKVAIKYRDNKMYTDKEFKKAVGNVANVYKMMGKDGFCAFSEGLFAKMDRDVAAAQ